MMGPAYLTCREVAALFGNEELGGTGWSQLVRIARYVRKQEAIKPVKHKRSRRKSAMDEAAEACGLVNVRGALGGIYYE